MSTVAHISLEQYERMVETGCFDGRLRQRVELIQGEIRDMNPIGSRHEMALTALTDWSYQSVPLRKVMIRVQMTLRIPATDSAPQPDLTWVRRRNYSDLAPDASDVLLLVEISDSSLAMDRGEKASLYAGAGVVEYWIVNLIDHCLEVFRNPTAGKYQDVASYRDDQPIEVLAFPGASLLPRTLFSSCRHG